MKHDNMTMAYFDTLFYIYLCHMIPSLTPHPSPPLFVCHTELAKTLIAQGEYLDAKDMLYSIAKRVCPRVNKQTIQYNAMHHHLIHISISYMRRPPSHTYLPLVHTHPSLPVQIDTL